MKKILLITLIIFLGNITGFSQNLSIDSLSAELAFPDSVSYNSTSSQTIVVEITGGSPYTGNVYLMAAVDSSNGNQSIDTVAIRNVLNKQNDTITFTYNETYNNSNGYRVGGHVVVVWPIAATLTTVDTFKTNIHVNQVVGINENQSYYNDLIIYPNPSKNYINIKNKNQKIKVKQVRILDIKGRVVYHARFTYRIDVSKLKRGIYFLNLELDNHEILHYKLIKDE